MINRNGSYIDCRVAAVLLRLVDSAPAGRFATIRFGSEMAVVKAGTRDVTVARAPWGWMWDHLGSSIP